MSTEHVITKRAATGDLTVPELREFLAELDKATASGDGETVNETALKVRVRSGMRGQVKSITVTVPGGNGKS